jgi:hypothetical protein
MGFGGPVWHASVHAQLVMPQSALVEEAVRQLAGVGDAALGEWWEKGRFGFVHLRRRLTPKEMTAARIEDVCDVRGTPEYQARIERMRPWLPEALRAMPLESYP